MKRGGPLQRSALKPGAKSLERGSTFASRGDGMGRKPPATAPSDFRDADGNLIAVRPLPKQGGWLHKCVRCAARFACPDRVNGEERCPICRALFVASSTDPSGYVEFSSGRAAGSARSRIKSKVPAGARAAAYARTSGRCLMCPARAVQVHHVLPRHRWPHLAKLAANLVGICPGCHDNHERAHRRIPRALLPAETLTLAESEGLTWYIERTYPVPRGDGSVYPREAS